MATAQEIPEILDQSEATDETYLPDFSYAGYGFGTDAMPEFDQTISVRDHGAIPDDGKDDSIALLAALAAAHEAAGPVRVQMEAGRYILSEIMWIERSDIVLSGMGMGQSDGSGGTQIYMPRPLNQMDDGGALKELREYLVQESKYERQPVNNLEVLFSEWSWSGGFIWTRVPGGRHATYLESYDPPIEEIADIDAGQRGSRELTVSNPGELSVGDVVQIHWHNRAGENGPLIAEMYGDSDIKIGSRHWTNPDRPLVRQATRIERIEAGRITIADPLLHNISGTLPANFAKWDHLKNVGLEDFAMVFPSNPEFGHHNEAGFNGVYFTGVHNGWINNLAISEADAGIMTDDAANVTIANVRTDGDHLAHYSVHVGNVHNVLVDGVTVFNPTVHSLSFNTQATKSVYRNAVVWQTPSLDQHAGANHQNLYDNATVHITPDEVSADGSPMFDLFVAGGAGYWQPGHGRYSTTWNLNVIVEGNATPDQPVTIPAGSEGPNARMVGLHGNRELRLDFTPAPYVEFMNQPVATIPSLYSYQLAQRFSDTEGED